MVTFQATQLRLHSKIRLRSFELRYNSIKRYTFNPKSSYAYVPRYAATLTFQDTQLCLRSKVRFLIRSVKLRFWYAFNSESSYAYVPRSLTFLQVTLWKGCAFNPESSYAYASRYAATLMFQYTQLRTYTLTFYQGRFWIPQDSLPFPQSALKNISHTRALLHLFSRKYCLKNILSGTSHKSTTFQI